MHHSKTKPQYKLAKNFMYSRIHARGRKKVSQSTLLMVTAVCCPFGACSATILIVISKFTVTGNTVIKAGFVSSLNL